jgi:hypothetical protein
MMNRREKSRTNVLIASTSQSILNRTRRVTGSAKNVDVYCQKSIIVVAKAVGMKTSILHVTRMVPTSVRSVVRNWK